MSPAINILCPCLLLILIIHLNVIRSVRFASHSNTLSLMQYNTSYLSAGTAALPWRLLAAKRPNQRRKTSTCKLQYQSFQNCIFSLISGMRFIESVTISCGSSILANCHPVCLWLQSAPVSMSLPMWLCSNNRSSMNCKFTNTAFVASAAATDCIARESHSPYLNR